MVVFVVPYLTRLISVPNEANSFVFVQDFIHNQRKINNGEDFPRQFLTDIFNRIRLTANTIIQKETNLPN